MEDELFFDTLESIDLRDSKGDLVCDLVFRLWDSEGRDSEVRSSEVLDSIEFLDSTEFRESVDFPLLLLTALSLRLTERETMRLNWEG